uniref:Myb-like domain-containing protein n=1 Tax=Brassica oleracea var. oleracea TaxID=109376 RepID=A0A0D3D7H9_BRAOL
MDSNPYRQNPNFVGLLNSQQDIAFGSYEDSVELSSSQVPFLPTQGTADSNFVGNTPPDCKERRKWTPSDDMLLISSWLNTSKEAVREGNNCKHRWHKINEQVCKFCGAYEDATRERSSGQNENDVVKRAHEIFYNNHKKRFLLEHAWNELRNDQKWCELSSSKNAESSKKRKGDEDGADCSSSQPTETMRLEGVKAAKAHGKKTVVEENAEGECGQGVSVYGVIKTTRLGHERSLVERVHGSGAVVNDWSREWSCFLSCSCHVVVMCEMLLLWSCCGHVSYSFDEEYDQFFDQYLDHTFENLLIANGDQQDERRARKKRIFIERNREEGHLWLWNDYFSDTPTYPENLFRRRFRMNKRLFMHIVERLSNEVPFFRQKKDGIGRLGLSTLQKCTAAIHVLAYGSVVDAVDEYIRLGGTTARLCVENFVEAIMKDPKIGSLEWIRFGYELRMEN